MLLPVHRPSSVRPSTLFFLCSFKDSIPLFYHYSFIPTYRPSSFFLLVDSLLLARTRISTHARTSTHVIWHIFYWNFLYERRSIYPLQTSSDIVRGLQVTDLPSSSLVVLGIQGYFLSLSPSPRFIDRSRSRVGLGAPPGFPLLPAEWLVQIGAVDGLPSGPHFLDPRILHTLAAAQCLQGFIATASTRPPPPAHITAQPANDFLRWNSASFSSQTPELNLVERYTNRFNKP